MMLLALLNGIDPGGGGVRESIQHVSDTHDQIVLALVAIVATSIGALVYAIKNNGLGVKINRAVNNVGPGEHHLIDLIKQIQTKQDDFDRAWGNLPDEMDDAVGLVELLHGMKADIGSLKAAVDEHVEWEMSVKYPKPGD